MNIITIGSKAYGVSDEILSQLNKRQERLNNSDENEIELNKAELEHYIAKVAIKRGKDFGYVLFDYRI